MIQEAFTIQKQNEITKRIIDVVISDVIVVNYRNSKAGPVRPYGMYWQYMHAPKILQISILGKEFHPKAWKINLLITTTINLKASTFLIFLLFML